MVSLPQSKRQTLDDSNRLARHDAAGRAGNLAMTVSNVIKRTDRGSARIRERFLPPLADWNTCRLER